MPAPSFVATIVANGQRYSAWKSVTVRRDYGDWQSTFQFTAAEPVFPGKGWGAVPLRPGDKAQILLGGKKVIDGTITTRVASIDAQSHDLVVAGKSQTQKLEASVDIKPGKLDGSTFEQAARSVMGPTGVGLKLLNPPGIASKPFRSLVAQYGETVGEFVERMAKMRGLFLTDDEHGNLVASQLDPGAAPVAALQEGRNILRATARLDNQNAFSSLGVVSQQTGDDGTWPPRDVSATAKIPDGPPGKKQIIIAEHPGDADEMRARADYETAHCLWPIVDVSITVVGWFRDDGSLWDVTDNVVVYAPSLFPNQSGSMTLGIQACIYQQDSFNGTTTTLELKLPNALSSLPNPMAGQSGFAGSGMGVSPQPAQADPPDTGMTI